MLSRRSVLKSAAAVPFAGTALATSGRDWLQDDYGVASGSPRPTSIVLWTRLPDRVVAVLSGAVAPVQFVVSTTPSFQLKDLVWSGEVLTGPASDYTVKVKIDGLTPGSYYYYQFMMPGLYESVTGRTKTAPTAGTVKFAIVSCQHLQSGFYTPYSYLAADSVDFCVHLGDHIYERETPRGRRPDALGGEEAKTLDDYRARYRAVMKDSDWRRVRALFPWIDLWDDHEVFNNYSRRDVADHKERVRGAYQAFVEYNPTEASMTLNDEGVAAVNLYARYDFGPLLTCFALDSRQHRDPHPCRKKQTAGACGADDAERTMLGGDQRRWLTENLSGATERWKVVLSPVMFSPFQLTRSHRQSEEIATKAFGKGLGVAAPLYFNLDQWDGFPAERQAIIDLIRTENITNVLVCAGDLHTSVSTRIPGCSAYEIVTPSITTQTLGETLGGALSRLAQKLLHYSNPHFDWTDFMSHGYVSLDVQEEGIRADFVAVETVRDRSSPLRFVKSLFLAAGPT